jgi:hypothetical protein
MTVILTLGKQTQEIPSSKLSLVYIGYYVSKKVLSAKKLY